VEVLLHSSLPPELARRAFLTPCDDIADEVQRRLEKSMAIRLVDKRPVGETPTGATETVALPGNRKWSDNRIGMEKSGRHARAAVLPQGPLTIPYLA
jgi:hypothetical protein